MQYVQCKDNIVDLKETNEKGELVHHDILPKVQNTEETDTILFNESMNMINRDLQNIKRSGLEIWHKLNKNSDPNTYNTNLLLLWF